MADDCCLLVGNLQLGLDGCITSFSDSCTTEIGATCGDVPLAGPTTGTVNFTAFGDDEVWIGCPSSASVSINYIKKFDCDLDKTYFIFSGAGQASYNGEADRYVTITNVLNSSCESISADSSSGPASIYTRSRQVTGSGMTYNGGPIRFTTSSTGTKFTFSNSVLTAGEYYLTSFNLNLQPGSLPTATYSFVYAVD